MEVAIEKVPMRTVAVIGMHGEFPGSEGLEEYFRSLENKENHVKEIPTSDVRWNVDHFYDENPNVPGKAVVKNAGLLENIYDWDNTAFDVNEFEAKHMDPQQRLILKVVYRALEHAGITEEQISGTDTAVYIGLMNDDYARLLTLDDLYSHNYTPTGTASSIVSNRVSYTFNLHGPSMTLDTACSSSLVAVHEGFKSILLGESTMAVCGGVNLILGPGPFVGLSKAGMTSKEGQCFAFSSRADGYARSEGCGVVILKDAKKAIEDGDNILCFLSTECNSDGHAETPVHKPSKHMQKALIERGLNKQGIQPYEVEYVEMHGTGTPVGDPVETSAVGEVLGKARKEKGLPPLMIGSVKTNIGHTESAAGIAGLIKTVLMMNQDKYLPTLFTESPSSRIDFQSLHINVVDKVYTWNTDVKSEKDCKIALVNCFGFGGTNAVAILQKFPTKVKSKISSLVGSPYHLVCFSGKTENSVRTSIEDTAKAFESGHLNSSDIPSIAYTSTKLRKHYKHRKGILLNQNAPITDVIGVIREASKSNKIPAVRNADNNKVNTTFIFPGMGTHWKHMGMDLYNNLPIFKFMIDEVDKHLATMAKFSVRECIHGIYDVENPLYGQVTIFGIQVAISHVLKDAYGVVPNVVLGHSMGEVAAACVSNSLDLTSAVRVIYERSQLLGQVQGGAMLAVSKTNLDELNTHLSSNNFGKLEIAAFNTSRKFTVTGDNEEIELLKEILEKKNVLVKKLNVTTAYHSAAVCRILPLLEKKLKNLSNSENKGRAINAKILHISTAACEEQKQIFTSEKYWMKNVRNAVMFETAFKRALRNDRKNIVVEIGPKPALKSYVNDLIGGVDCIYAQTMSPQGSCEDFLDVVIKGYEAGGAVNCERNETHSPSTWPRYGFDSKKLFEWPLKTAEFLAAEESVDFLHPFVCRKKDKEYFRSLSTINQHIAPFVYDHLVGAEVVAPGALYVEIVLATKLLSMPDLFQQHHGICLNIFFEKACVIPKNTELKLTTTFFEAAESKSLENEVEFDITMGNKKLASGVTATNKDFLSTTNFSVKETRERCPQYFGQKDLYSKLQQLNFYHGPKLQCIKCGWYSKKEVIAEVCSLEGMKKGYILHPVILDCFLQSVVMFPTKRSWDVQVLPLGIDLLTLTKSPPSECLVYLKLKESTANTMVIDGLVVDKNGKIFVECKGLRIGAVSGIYNLNPRETMFNLSWKEIEVDEVDTTKEVKCLFISNYDSEEVKKMTESGIAHATLSINQVIDSDGKARKSFMPNLQEFTDIVYAFQSQDSEVLVELSGREISNLLAFMCQGLLSLVLHVQQNSPSSNVILLTNQVHNILRGQKCNNSVSGTIGSGLLGMMRTVMIENPAQSYCAIDLSDTTVETLQKLKQTLLIDVKPTEITIARGRSSISCFNHDFKLKNVRKVQCEPEQAIDVFAELKNGSYSQIRSKLSVNSKKLAQASYVTVDLKSAFIVWPNQMDCASLLSSESERQLLAFSALGRETKWKDVHIIGLIPVGSCAEVHTSCIIPKSIFPSELPTATVWFFAWLLTNHERSFCSSLPGNTAFVTSSEYTSTWRLAVIQICELRGVKVTSNANEANSIYCIASCNEDVEFLLEDLCLEGKKVYVLALTKRLQNRISSTFQFQILDLESTLSYREKLESHIASFREWLEQCNEQNLSKSSGLVNQTLNGSVMAIDTLNHDFGNFEVNDLILTLEGSETVNVEMRMTEIYRKDGAYLVFGGSKGLGWETVQELATSGVAKIGIVSRTGLNEEKKLACAELELSHHCNIVDMRADVANIANVLQIASEFEKSDPSKRVRGVFVGTAILDDAIIPEMNIEKMEKVMLPKVAGIINIARVFASVTLDFFVAHSSVAGLIGNGGQTNYAAANAFVDAFMCCRHSEGKVGQSICWGALDLGLVDNDKTRATMQKLGIQVLKRDEIMQMLSYAVLYNPPLISLARFSWEVFIRRMKNIKVSNYFFRDLFKRRGHYLSVPSKRASSAPSDNDNSLGYLHQIIRSVVMMEEYEVIDDYQSLEAIGVDSMYSQLVYSTLLVDFKEMSSLTPITLQNMTVRELHKYIQQHASDS